MHADVPLIPKRLPVRAHTDILRTKFDCPSAGHCTEPFVMPDQSTPFVAKARLFLVFAALAGFSGVALGAFGAHGLKEVLAPHQLIWWSTAVQYHLVHAVALLGIAAWLQISPTAACSRWLCRSGWMMVLGLLLFCGSLYSMALTDLRALGIVTPFGGLSWLMGWFGLVIVATVTPAADEPASH